MAFADMHTGKYPSGLELESGDLAPGAPPYYCAIAIGALEKASTAIECADIEARCKSVATATEAMTSLFLELDGIGQNASAQGAGRLYESILRRLLGINLTDNAEIAFETIAIIERLRDTCPRGCGTGAPAGKTALHRANP